MTKTRLVWWIPYVVALGGCSDAPPVDLGHRVAELADYAASWDGYAEAYTFPEGSSDRVRVVLDATGEGTIEVGDAPLDPVPTDPDVGLPGKPGRFHDGFRYPIHAANVEAGRIRLEVDPGARFAPWCAIQRPYPNGSDFPPGYMCVSLGSYERFTQGLPVNVPGTAPSIEDIAGCAVWQVDPNDAPNDGVSLLNPAPVDCNRYTPCVGGICACTASACTFDPTVPRPDGYRVRMDGALDGDGTSLVGTLAIMADWDHPDVADRVTIRLRRQ